MQMSVYNLLLLPKNIPGYAAGLSSLGFSMRPVVFGASILAPEKLKNPLKCVYQIYFI